MSDYPTETVEIDGIEITVHFDDLQSEYLDHDSEERMVTYIATGFDANGRTYKAIAEFCCDELVKIEDIEQD